MEYQSIDQTTQDAIKNRVGAATQLAQGYVQGAPSQGFIPIAENVMPNYEQYGIDNAIKGRADRTYRDTIDKINAQKQYEAPIKAFDSLQRSKQLQLGESKQHLAKLNAIRQRIAQEESQRAMVLGSLLGLAGTIGGAAIAGPPGAAVGAGVGNAAGTLESRQRVDDSAGQSYRNYDNYT